MDITIVVPVYNRRECVRKVVDSIGVAYPLILVDNGSDDGSDHVCKEIAAERANTLFLSESRRGAAAARNKGLAACRTKWVYFFDSDDEFTGLPETWDEAADMVCIPTSQYVGGRLKVRDYSPVAHPHVHVLNSMLNTLSMIFRTDFLREIGGWNSDCMIWNDWELGLRALLQCPRVQWITEKSYHVIRPHADSITGVGLTGKVDEIVKSLGFAFEDIYNVAESDANRQRAFAALFYRCYIVSGVMMREGGAAEAAKVRGFIYDRFRVNGLSHRMGRMLQWASSNGIRGVWRIALRIV